MNHWHQFLECVLGTSLFILALIVVAIIVTWNDEGGDGGVM